MLTTIQYTDDANKQTIINENADKILVEIRNLIDGNYLVFSDQKINGDVLSDVQTSKLAQINDLYNQKLAEGFTSSASGTEHAFSYSSGDVLKFLQLDVDVKDGNSPIPIPIPAKDGVVPHTIDQYAQLKKDISAFAWSMQNKYHSFIDQVNACTTVDQVNAVVVNF